VKKPDSIISAEERAKAIRAESAQREKEMAEAEAKRKELAAMRDEELRQVEETNIRHMASLSDIDTRDHLLEHIRIMRAEVPHNPTPAPHLSESMRKEMDAEMALGRAMVAKVEAEQARNLEMRRRIEEEERARSGHMTTVYSPNPSQTEQFTASKATLGKLK
jgi:hypothetical protein